VNWSELNPRNAHRLRTPVVASFTALAIGLFGFALWTSTDRPAHAGARSSEADQLDYASPLEVLLSPDGARLYVLCQQSGEVRVLDASSYAVIGKIAVGRVPRGIALSDKGDRLFVTNTRRQAPLCRQSHLERHRRPRRPNRSGREASAGRARFELFDALPGWKPHLRHAHLSEWLTAAHPRGKSQGA